MSDEIERDFIVSLFEQSAKIYCRPPVYWKDPHGFQAWARARSLFEIDGGIRTTPGDTTAAGRKQFSRLRLRLKAFGLIEITRHSETSQAICLTPAGLKLAENLTGKKASTDLRKAIETIVSD